MTVHCFVHGLYSILNRTSVNSCDDKRARKDGFVSSDNTLCGLSPREAVLKNGNGLYNYDKHIWNGNFDKEHPLVDCEVCIKKMKRRGL